MNATIDSIQVSGTPEEIQRFKELCEKEPDAPLAIPKNIVPDNVVPKDIFPDVIIRNFWDNLNKRKERELGKHS
jgi:hypothetical protein